MTYRALFFQALALLFFGGLPFTFISAEQRPMPSTMQDIEQEIAEANKAIEEYVSSLSPAEQAEFNRQVEEFSQMFETMSDEEFEKFLGDMFSEEQMPQPDFAQIPQPFMEEEIIEVPQLSAEQLKKVETAIAILDDIIKQSNMFMVIVSSAPELPNRINQWGKKGSISDWQEGMTWDTLRVDLEYFIQKLYKMQEKDLTTKEYRYLLDLIADEALYNNIIQLRTSLNSLLPIINIPEFGIQKISSQSKEAIQDILKKYTESFYLLGIPKALDAIFEKYEPQAKKIREAESGAARRALEASREPRFPAEATEAGVEPEMGYGYDSYGYGDYDYGYSPYYGGGYDSGYSPYYGGGYDAGYSPETSFDRGNGRRRNGGPREISPGGPRAEKAPSEEKEEKEKEKAEEFIPHVEITEIIGRIKNSLEQITATLTGEEYPQLKDLVTHVRDQEVNNDLANYILPTVINKNIIALSDNIKKIDELSKKLNSVTLSTYQSEIKKVFGKNRKELEKLSKDLTLFEPLTEAEKKRAAEAKKTGAEEEEEKEEEEVPQKVDITTLSPHKRWAYFADEDAKKELEEEGSDFTEKVVNPKSLRTIKKNIDNLFKEVKAYGERKAAPKKVEKKIEKPAE